MPDEVGDDAAIVFSMRQWCQTRSAPMAWRFSTWWCRRWPPTEGGQVGHRPSLAIRSCPSFATLYGGNPEPVSSPGGNLV